MGAAWTKCLRVHRHRKTVGVQDNRDPALGCLNPLDKPDSLEIWKDTGRWVYGYSTRLGGCRTFGWSSANAEGPPLSVEETCESSGQRTIGCGSDLRPTGHVVTV